MNRPFSRNRLTQSRLFGGMLWLWLGLLGGLPAAVAQDAVAQDEADLGPGVSLTVYNQDFAIVKERRLMELAQGTGLVKFPDVAATIVPESVQFSSLRPTGATVLEQNYEFDLVSANKLLDKYIDRSIRIVTRDGGLIEGKLLAADAGQLVLSNRQGIQLVPRERNVKDIRFLSLPKGLLTRPTLVWKVRAEEAGEHLIKVAYRANSINWRVDYRAVASADEKTLDLSGWVTINNQTGTTFHDAGLKLMAGDVHLVKDQRFSKEIARGRKLNRLLSKREGVGFEEKSFAEYHLYTLGRRTTLANAQTKQIELIAVEQIPVEKEYLYKPDFGSQVGTVLVFKNSKTTRPGLGIPLPKGPFRVYLRDADGEPEFVGKDQIDHTPKDEPVRIRVGYAFDLVADRVQTGNRRKGGERWNEQDWRITLRNHKPQPVRILVEEPLRANRNWQILKHSPDFTKKDYRTLRFEVEVPAGGQQVVSYTIRYTW
jgi:hypothetical protein